MNHWLHKKKSWKTYFFCTNLLVLTQKFEYQISLLLIEFYEFYVLGVVERVSVSSCQIKWQNSHIFYKSSISTFKVKQRSTQDQTIMLYKKHLTVHVLLIHANEAYLKHFQTYYIYPLFLAMPYFKTSRLRIWSLKRRKLSLEFLHNSAFRQQLLFQVQQHWYRHMMPQTHRLQLSWMIQKRPEPLRSKYHLISLGIKVQLNRPILVSIFFIVFSNIKQFIYCQIIMTLIWKQLWAVDNWEIIER